MKTIGNIIWCLVIGLWSALFYLFLGVILCITIIGIPFGKQLFKMAKLVFLPFGKEVNSNFDKHPIANILWVVFGGFVEAMGFVFAGLFFCITIIGIPFGKQCFKLAKLSCIPFGATVD